MSDPLLVCHFCGHHDPSATLGVRCPADGSILVPSEEHTRCPDDQMLGRVIGGKYAILGRLGSGAMGAVYRALQEPIGREVAVKVILHGTAAGDEQLRARFIREAKTVARLSNPSTVTLIDYGFEPDGVLYMVLELVRGRRLSDVLSAEGPLPASRIVPIARQVLNSLAEAHALGLVHRDIKPDNIMLAPGPWGEELAKVLDFGIAKVRADDPERVLQTQAGVVLGTPLFMAPEQALERGVDGRADLYAVGVILYQALTGRLPFEAETVFEVLLAHREKPVPAFPAAVGVAPDLEAAVRKALEKRPEDRFQDAASMAQALLAAAPSSELSASQALAANSASRTAPPVGGEPTQPAEPAAEIPSVTPILLVSPVTGTDGSSPDSTASGPGAPAEAASAPVTEGVEEPAAQSAGGPVLPVVPGPARPKVTRPGWVLPVALGLPLLLIVLTAVSAWQMMRARSGGQTAASRSQPSDAQQSLARAQRLLGATAGSGAQLPSLEPTGAAASGSAADSEDPADPGAAGEQGTAPDTADGDPGAGEAIAQEGSTAGAPSEDSLAGQPTDEGHDPGHSPPGVVDQADPGIGLDVEPAIARTLFEDDFKRANFHAVGGRWREYELRKQRAKHALRQGEGSWVIRTNTLSIHAQAWTGDVEDLVMTEDDFAIDGTRVEFEMRGQLAGVRRNAGPLAFWIADPAPLKSGLAGVVPDTIGVGWNMATGAPALHVFAGGAQQDHPGLRPAGFDPAAWVRHSLTVRGDTLTYQVGEAPPVSTQLATPPAPGSRWRFAFALRAYEKVWHKVDVRNFRIVELEPSAR